jgi:hypothetical protein
MNRPAPSSGLASSEGPGWLVVDGRSGSDDEIGAPLQAAARRTNSTTEFNERPHTDIKTAPFSPLSLGADLLR